MKISKSFGYLATIALSFVLLLTTTTSCDPDKDVVPVVEVKDTAKILFFHAAPDGPKVNFSVDGVKRNVDSVAYATSPSYYDVIFKAGVKPVRSFQSGGKTIFSDSTAVNASKGLVGYSYFIFQDSLKNLRVATLSDNISLPTAGKAKMRFVHLIPNIFNGRKLDIQFVKAGQAATADKNFSNIGFSTIGDFIELTPDTYDIKVKYAGETAIVFTAANVVVAANKVYTAVAHGLETPPAVPVEKAKKVTIITNR
jgi:hypothetical protein